MCIRDRGYSQHPQQVVRIGDRPVLGIGARLLGHVGGRVAAVSYTHLRAHETVLDLVCRLLLEKKNRRKWQQHLVIDPQIYDLHYSPPTPR